MGSPIVSVILSVNRDRGRLDATLSSVLEQSYEDIELIVVNDAAPADVRMTLDRRRAVDRRIKVIANDSNLGLTRSLNRGLACATGRYIARIDEGDLWLPGKLRAQVAFLEGAPEYMIVGTQYRAYWNEMPEGRSGTRLPIDDAEIRRWLFVGRTPLIHPSILFRSGLVRYNDGARTSQDFELYLRLSLVGKLRNLADELLMSYTPVDAVSVNHEDLQFTNHVHMHRTFMRVLSGDENREEFIREGANFERLAPRGRVHAGYMRVTLRAMRRLPKRSLRRRILRNLLMPEFLVYYVRTRSAPYRMTRTYASYLDEQGTVRT